MGIPLLRLEATIVLAPAATTRSTRPLGRAKRSGSAEAGLAEAVRSINEGAELLAEVRRNGI
jgi:hypothetical protein